MSGLRTTRAVRLFEPSKIALILHHLAEFVGPSMYCRI
jgi:hypothetical protein